MPLDYTIADMPLNLRTPPTYTVHTGIFYVVDDAGIGHPTGPVQVQRFRVAECIESGVSAFYAVSPEAPEGPIDSSLVGPYIGSQKPKATTPEAAILDYWKQLGPQVQNAQTLIARFAAERNHAQTHMNAAILQRQGFEDRRDRIAEGFRTIPKITDEAISVMLKRLPPVMRMTTHLADALDVGYRYLPLAILDDLRNVAFTWAPKAVVGAEALDLVPCGEAQTYHAWAYYGIFKPSLAEVYACIGDAVPADAEFFWLDPLSVQVDGMPILHRPDPHCPDGYHRATITFLKRRSA